MFRKWRLTPKSIISYKNVTRLVKNACVWFCCNANGDYNSNIPLVFTPYLLLLFKVPLHGKQWQKHLRTGHAKYMEILSKHPILVHFKRL